MELRGVGVLTVKEKRERRGRNPSSGQALIIEPHRVVRFRASCCSRGLTRPAGVRNVPKSDPRQLAFQIDGDQETTANIETSPMLSRLPRLARGRKKHEERAIYEQATEPRGTTKPAQKKPARKKLATKPAKPIKVRRGTALAEVVAQLVLSAEKLSQAADRLAEAADATDGGE